MSLDCGFTAYHAVLTTVRTLQEGEGEACLSDAYDHALADSWCLKAFSEEKRGDTLHMRI